MIDTQTKNKSLGRLKKRSDFLRVQSRDNPLARKWVAKGMIVEILPTESGAPLRFGLTVSKRVSKLAVTRNRVKRRLRAVAVEVLPEFSHHPLDIVLIGRIEGEARNFEDLKNDLRWCLKKLGYAPLQEA